MTIIDDKIRDENSGIPSGKIDKYWDLACEEIFPSNQRQRIEQATFEYSPLEKAFEKQTEKQVGPIKSLGPSS